MKSILARGTASGMLMLLGLAILPLRAVEIATTPPPLPQAAKAPVSSTGLTLEECYQEALLNNPRIRSARAGFENALGAKIILQATALPTLNARFITGVQRQTGDEKPRVVAILNSTFYQPLFDASIPPSFRQGRTLVAMAQQDFFVAASTELNALRTAFYQALAARENVAVEESIRTRLKANLTLQEQSASVGRVGKQVVDTAALRLAEIEPDLSTARGAYRDARIEMAIRMGRDLDAETPAETQVGLGNSASSALDAGLPLPKGVLEPITFRIDYQAETDYALAHRPDLAALRLLIASAQNQADIAGAPRYPRVGASANLSFIPRTLLKKDTGNLPMTQLAENLGVSWTILDGGSVRGGIVNAEAARDGYRILLRQLESDVPRNLRQIVDSLRTVNAMVESSTLAVTLAEENYRITEAQVANGNAVQLDLLNAQSNLLNAQYTRINALLENSLAVAQFDTVTGRYLDFIPDAAGPDGAPAPKPVSAKAKTAAAP